MSLFLIVSAAVWLCVAPLVVCGADVEVIGTGAIKSSIDLSGIQAGPDSASRLFATTLENDLVRSGWGRLWSTASAGSVGA
jgi:hypothetical protein